jgi:hypothetical protein
MAKQSTNTVINWVLVFIGALFVLPRALAAVKASTSAQRASTIPTAAAQTQAARAINTAGYAGNTWLSRLLSQMLGQNSRNGGSQKSGTSSSGSPGAVPKSPQPVNDAAYRAPYISYVDPAQIHQPDFSGLQQERYWEQQSNVEAPDPMTVGGSDLAEWDMGEFGWLNSGLPTADDVVWEPDALTVGGYYGPEYEGNLSALDFLNDTSYLAIAIPEMVGSGGGSSDDDNWNNYPDAFAENE